MLRLDAYFLPFERHDPKIVRYPRGQKRDGRVFDNERVLMSAGNNFPSGGFYIFD